MHHPEFPSVSFISIPLLLCSLPSHLRAGSVCTVALMGWLVVMSLIRGVNALVWADNFVVRLEVWCDITTKILIGFTYAVPASALCILRHLENVASTRSVLTTKEDRRRRQIFEAIMCFGVPALFMALHYVVQGHRFDLIEGFGCYPSVYVSVAGLCLVYIPPIAMSLVSFVYAALALHHFLRRRIEFAIHLQSSQSFITPGRYFRLMALAIVEMAWDTGVNAYIIYFNINLTGLRPWISWENVHSNFSRVGVFPEFIMPPEVITQLIWQWWIVPISCLCFFIFFAFGEEAMSDYRSAIVWLRSTILRQRVQKPNPHGTGSIIPVYRYPRLQNLGRPSCSSSDDDSERKSRPWEDLSFKIPDISDDYPSPAKNKHEAPGPSIVQAVDRVLDSASICGISSSPDELRPYQSPHFPLPSSPSTDRSLALCCPPADDDNQRDSFTGSTLAVTRPGSIDMANRVESAPLPMAQLLPPGRRSFISHLSTQPSGVCHSTCPDDNITVSEAYFPNPVLASQYHNAALLAQPAPDAAAHLASPPRSLQAFGGVRVTVERDVA